MNIFLYVDRFLNGITMYKVVLFGLSLLAVLSVALGFFGALPFSGFSLTISLATLIATSYLSNRVFAYILKVDTNAESYFITALILYFLLLPGSSLNEIKFLALAAFIAMASKYVLVINKKHVFNPAAISLVVLGLFGVGLGSWWVGSLAMLVPVSVLGLLILRKVKRFTMFFVFVMTSLISVAIAYMNYGFGLMDVFTQALISGPIIFFGTVMLTEPLTTPPQRKFQIMYVLLVGALYGVQFNIGPVYGTPELALVLGNIFSYIVSPRQRLLLVLEEKKKLSADVYEFVWKIINSSSNKLSFKAGQYLEWTLGHDKVDMRGNRRYFTIASSPTENGVRLGVKFYDNSSSFKKKLISLVPGDRMIASQLAGDFVLPNDTNKKLAFIAGGIGITPFRSMVKQMVDSGEKRNVVLLFSNKTPQDIVYKELFDDAEKVFGMKSVYVVNSSAGGENIPHMKMGMITADLIATEVPDFKERAFYISGSHGMVTAFEDQLQKMGVPKKDIKVDFFPGFA